MPRGPARTRRALAPRGGPRRDPAPARRRARRRGGAPAARSRARMRRWRSHASSAVRTCPRSRARPRRSSSSPRRCSRPARRPRARTRSRRLSRPRPPSARASRGRLAHRRPKAPISTVSSSSAIPTRATRRTVPARGTSRRAIRRTSSPPSACSTIGHGDASRRAQDEPPHGPEARRRSIPLFGAVSVDDVCVASPFSVLASVCSIAQPRPVTTTGTTRLPPEERPRPGVGRVQHRRRHPFHQRVVLPHAGDGGPTRAGRSSVESFTRASGRRCATSVAAATSPRWVARLVGAPVRCRPALNGIRRPLGRRS